MKHLKKAEEDRLIVAIEKEYGKLLYAYENNDMQQVQMQALMLHERINLLKKSSKLSNFGNDIVETIKMESILIFNGITNKKYA